MPTTTARLSACGDFSVHQRERHRSKPRSSTVSPRRYGTRSAPHRRARRHRKHPYLLTGLEMGWPAPHPGEAADVSMAQRAQRLYQRRKRAGVGRKSSPPGRNIRAARRRGRCMTACSPTAMPEYLGGRRPLCAGAGAALDLRHFRPVGLVGHPLHRRADASGPAASG